MSDLIRREDVLEALLGWGTDPTDGEIEYYVNSIPTEEPLVTVKAKQNEGLYLNTDEETLLETEYIVVATDGWYKEYIHETDGKPKVGKWIKNEHGLKCCSVCGKRPLQICYYNICLDGYDGKDILSKYCPHCGAEMKGASDE